jgi:hypothetical protein
MPMGSTASPFAVLFSPLGELAGSKFAKADDKK